MKISDALKKSLTYLTSLSAEQSIERDPYWPKWDSPWWHMCLLHEIGLSDQIPKSIVFKMVNKLKTHYLPVFPINESDFPAGTDPYRQVACPCAVGNMYQVLFACGVDLDQELPWMKQWILKYQLSDGGLNCDEKAYTKSVPKSSIVTTVACLEAILFCNKNTLSDEETVFLDRGANYLLKQKLFRKVSTDQVIDDNWLEIRFPRFYEYDFLRGYYFLEKWHQNSGFKIPTSLTDEVKDLVAKQTTPEGIRLKRYNLFDKQSYNPNNDGTWSWGEASEIDLMKAVSFDGRICEPLTKKWNEVISKKELLPEFKTKRLILKPVTADDIPSYTKHFVDYEVIEHLAAGVPWPYPANGVEWFLKEVIWPHLGVNRWLWGIFEINNPTELIGCVDLWRDGHPENRGFWLGKTFWGQGYMTEAVEPVMNYAFKELGFEKLVFANAVGNIKSRRIKEKTGCRLIDIKPAKFVNSKYTEHEIWELRKEEWLKNKN